MIILHDDAYYERRKPLPDLGPVRNFMRFIWDGQKRTFIGRTGKEWAQLGIFYACFFSVLGSIFAIQMSVTVNYVSKLDKPFFQYSGVGARSHGRNNFPVFRAPWNFGSPGIVFKPHSSVSSASPIIWVNDSNTSARPKRYIRALTDFLQEYTNKNISKYDPMCNDENLRADYSDKPCFFDIKNLGECSNPPYGYSTPLQPCILIKFNKRFDWIPNYYNQTSALPEDMPHFLKENVKNSNKFRVWLSCDGANNVDKEHIGEIKYIPSPGFPVQFFPFTGQKDYLSPLVALKFKNLTPNRLVTVECTLWALNVDKHSRYSLDFQIIIGNVNFPLKLGQLNIHKSIITVFRKRL